MNRVSNIAVLGATGSIGKSAAAVIAAEPERFRLVAAAARSSRDELLRQTGVLKPSVVALTDQAAAATLRRDLPAGVKLLSGDESLVEIATLPEVDTVLCAVVGTGGLRAVLAALRAGKRVALASKEVLVMAGDIVNSIGTGELIDTVDGKVIYDVKAGTATGTRVRLRSKGVPSIQDKNVRGDHYVTLVTQTPERLTKEAKELLRQFDAITGDSLNEAKRVQEAEKKSEDGSSSSSKKKKFWSK